MQIPWLKVLQWALSWLLKNATFSIKSSATPEGSYLGGTDDPDFPDLFIVLKITFGPVTLLHGYWQAK
jgi:hypothetical protein